MRKLATSAAALLAVCCLTAAGAMASVSAAAPTTAPKAGPAAEPASLVVHTDKGFIRGVESEGTRMFLGVPYAAPPAGDLRWRPPQPAAPWRGIRNTVWPNSTCAQYGAVVTGEPVTSLAEDCLYLNVYTPPARPRRPLPVMVWIHGGAFTGGAGSIYDGAPLAARENVIVVTVNYRLGPFGFLALPSLDAESGFSGDYGLLDQQAALRWVQRNIASFGGNRHNVTIFGESAGGASVCANMASPAASGLFQRAIAESGCFLLGQTKQAAEQTGATFAAKLGCTDAATAVQCLRGKPVQDILNAAGGVPGGWGPVSGTPALPLPTAAAFQAGRYAHVPLIQGTNHDEGRFFVGFGYDYLGKPITAAEYPQILTAEFGAGAAAGIQAAYPLSAYPSPDLAYAAVFTDSSFSCPALRADQATWRSGAYGYEFADENAPNDFNVKFSFPLAAAHSTELQYVFGMVPTLHTVPPFTVAQSALSADMMSYWARFAATGDPNGGGAPYWPRFDPVRQQIQELVPSSTGPRNGFAAGHHCAFWSTVQG
jgi:para-nitrobenzyl esterase